MQLPLSWLKQWSSHNASESSLSEQLTVSGLETTTLSSPFTPFKGVVILEIVSVNAHPNADRLRVCTVSDRKAATYTIVCGASNVAQGLQVATALPGATLASGDVIQSRRIRGVLSQGMLCSLSELGLAMMDGQASKKGIWELPSDFPLGVDLWEQLGLGDPLLAVQVPPNRGDCLSAMGLAREISILHQVDFKTPLPSKVAVTIKDSLSIEIKDPVACPRYMGRILLNLNGNTPTPWWITTRLHQGGMRCINAIVDIINYTLLELGQPLHAFDLDQVSGPLSVRLAHTHETLTLLNKNTVTLKEETLIVADQNGPLAIAGIMGGLSSGVTNKTSHIFLESAFFTPAAMIGKARQYGIVTESSYRFERGVDPELAKKGLERATQRLLAICGGQAGPMVVQENREHLPTQHTITLDQAQITKLLGIDLSKSLITAQLQRIGMKRLDRPDNETGRWIVKAPSWRFDLTGSCDLIEEITRLSDYHQIPCTLPSYPLSFKATSTARNAIVNLKNCLVNQGYYEVINYSFVSSKHQAILDPNKTPVVLANPISSELNVLRTQLWQGLVKNLQQHQAHPNDSYRLFESGTVFLNEPQGITEHQAIAGVLTGARLPEQWGVRPEMLDLFDVKQIVDNSLKQLDPSAHYTYLVGQHPALHPLKSSQLCKNGAVIGWIGALHPRLYDYFELTEPVYLFEWKLPSQLPVYIPVFKGFSRFPSVKRDIAFWIRKDILFESIREVIARHDRYLVDLSLFDVYQSKEKPKQRSLALRLIWQHPNKTFTDGEVDALEASIIQALQEAFAIQLRHREDG